MNSFVVILSCLAAVTLANPQTSDVAIEFLANGRARCRHNCNAINPLSCPPTNCPPASRDPNCGPPNCAIAGNRVVLHPTTDPNDFYQCVQDVNLNWLPVRRPCACGTWFQSSANRCIHPRDWVRECNSQVNPILRECIEDCPGVCDDGGVQVPPPPPPPPTQPPPNGNPPPTDPPNGNNCPCPCVPCIWWPCLPCLSSCACQNQQQQRPNPWNPQPQPQPRPQPPQDPWQRPQPRPQPPQDPWNRQPQDQWNRQPDDQWNRQPQDQWNRPQQWDRW